MRTLLGYFVRLYNRLTWKKLNRIDDWELLWRAVYNKHQLKPDGTLKSNFFRDKNGLSCDLASYTTIKRALRGVQDPPRPLFGGLVEFSVESVRSPEIGSDVEHKPAILNYRRNYAHCQLTTYLTQGQSRTLKGKICYRVAPDLDRIEW